MSGLYEKIKRDKERKKDTRFWLMVTMLIAVIAVVIVSVVWFLRYHGRFTRFVGKLSGSTTYAHKNDCLIAEVKGKKYRVSEENMYGIYAYLSLNKSGRESRKVPEGEPVTLDYGSGVTLKLWDMPMGAGDNRRNLFIQYTDMKGDVYSYISYKTTLDTVVARYLTYGNEEITE